MKDRAKLFLAGVSAALLLLFAGHASAQHLLSVSGAVLMDGGSGPRALPKAHVELLSPGDDEVVLHQAYTDSRGRYVIRDVASGAYELRIKIGHQSLHQVTERGTVATRSFRLGSESIRLPDSLVRIAEGEDSGTG